MQIQVQTMSYLSILSIDLYLYLRSLSILFSCEFYAFMMSTVEELIQILEGSDDHELLSDDEPIDNITEVSFILQF